MPSFVAGCTHSKVLILHDCMQILFYYCDTCWSCTSLDTEGLAGWVWRWIDPMRNTAVPQSKRCISEPRHCTCKGVLLSQVWGEILLRVTDPTPRLLVSLRSWFSYFSRWTPLRLCSQSSPVVLRELLQRSELHELICWIRPHWSIFDRCCLLQAGTQMLWASFLTS